MARIKAREIDSRCRHQGGQADHDKSAGLPIWTTASRPKGGAQGSAPSSTPGILLCALWARLRRFKIAPDDFVPGLEYDIRGAITARCFETVANIPLRPVNDHRSVETAARVIVRHRRSSFSRSCASHATPARNAKPAAFATELLSSSAATAGTVCKVNALRPGGDRAQYGRLSNAPISHRSPRPRAKPMSENCSQRPAPAVLGVQVRGQRAY